jgi:hypothetical protein
MKSPRFCPSCGGAGYCLSHCRASSGMERYHQRTIWTARVMLSGLTNPQSREYYNQRIRTSERALAQMRQPQFLERAA